MINPIKAIPFFLLILLASCTNIYRAPMPSDHLVGKGHVLKHHWSKDHLTGLTYMSCDYGYYQSNDRMSEDLRKAAANYFIYALMASNAYIKLEDVQYDITGWRRIDRWESNRGLGFDVYVQDALNSAGTSLKNDGKEDYKPQLVVAFRGTESGFDDWWHANIAILFNGQYDEAVRAVETLKKAYPNHRLTVTGHSLGGALAVNTSLRVEEVNAIAFNTSPRFLFGKTFKQNRQVLLAEKGEGLQIARFLWRMEKKKRKYNIESYENYNFLNFNWYTKLIAEHSMYRLSRGLLLAAIAGGSEEAKGIFRDNFDRQYAIGLDEKCRDVFEDVDNSMPAITATAP